MPARFAATRDLLDKDLSKVTPDTAVKNIDDWEEGLAKLEGKAAKTIVKDLEALKKQLQSPKPKGDQIKKLLAKLGEETTNSAEDAPEAQQQKLRDLGAQLIEAAGDGDDEAAED